MNKENFKNLLMGLQSKELELNDTKGIEYTKESKDALANFKRLSEKLDISPLIVAYIYFSKHIDAIEYAIKSGKVLSESIESRIADARLYLALILALIEDNENA